MTPAVATLTSLLGANLVYELNKFGEHIKRTRILNIVQLRTITKDY